MNRKYLLFEAMGPKIYFRRYGYEPASILQLGILKFFKPTNFMKLVYCIYLELSFSKLISVN